MTNWDRCPAVESRPVKVGGVWVLSGTRIPLIALCLNTNPRR